MITTDEFEEFAMDAEPRLRRALAGHLPPGDVGDAVSEALLYAWEHRARVLTMDQPVGYLYRVAQSKSRRKRQGWLPWISDEQVPDIEPGLSPALAALPSMQARSVWLVHACGWTHGEAAEALGIRPSTVSTHTTRGLAALREQLGVSTGG